MKGRIRFMISLLQINISLFTKKDQTDYNSIKNIWWIIYSLTNYSENIRRRKKFSITMWPLPRWIDCWPNMRKRPNLGKSSGIMNHSLVSYPPSCSNQYVLFSSDYLLTIQPFDMHWFHFVLEQTVLVTICPTLYCKVSITC